MCNKIFLISFNKTITFQQQSPQHGQRFPNQGGQWNRAPRPGAPNGQRPQMVGN